MLAVDLSEHKHQLPSAARDERQEASEYEIPAASSETCAVAGLDHMKKKSIANFCI
jgi:hypothetical protein